MNRKQLIFLFVVLVVVGGSGLVLLNQHRESWAVHEARMGDKVLPNFQPNAVAAIHIQGGSELNVTRRNDVWRVRERWDYPANLSQISDLLIQLKDLKVVEAETVGASDLGRVNLDAPGKGANSGTLVEFKDAQGKVLDSLLIGKKHTREQGDSPRFLLAGNGSDGRYILLSGDPTDVLLVSNTLATLEPRPEAWLSRDFFKAEKIESISVAAPNPADSWKVSRETESSPWMLADSKPGETLDVRKPSRIASALGFPRFVDVISTDAPVATGLDKPVVATIKTFDHFAYTIKIGGKSTGDSYYMTVAVASDIATERVAGGDETPEDKKKSDEEFREKTKKLQSKLKQEQALAPWVYEVSSWILDPLVFSRAQILLGNQ